MSFEKFTVKAVEAIAEAQRVAGRMGNPEVRPAHILLTLLEQDKGIIPNLLNRVGTSPEQLKAGAAKLVGALPKVSGGTKAGVSPTATAATSRSPKSCATTGRTKARASSCSTPRAWLTRRLFSRWPVR